MVVNQLIDRLCALPGNLPVYIVDSRSGVIDPIEGLCLKENLDDVMSYEGDVDTVLEIVLPYGKYVEIIIG